ncbi:DUF4864 domain-containing protein [Antarcticirhabdus aurantiaca]|uniref:DUF4864 domain-containing protein n=1 Tax=Antarcticirhabdus aurantiaca TaxID=2606717 RepID=A0ACD4NWA3_9HYPH|nr:DUF4864 domain-containing protein [Antarcticirhabdus aurantiaca]WAJ30984.1 DUF4864 domain-containing protein [Jeongeuplla avenae]
MLPRRSSPFAAVLLAASLMTALPARADDAGDVQATIASQLQAFRSGDGLAAYSFAAPNIRAMFPDAGTFMSMVQQGYGPVYNAAQSSFGALKPEGSGFRQEVFLTDAKGVNWIASYTLERQADGSMKITGCSIRKSDDLSA